MEPKEFSGVEKRRFKRLNKQFVVRIQIQGGFSKTWDVVLIQNISKGGLLFSYYKPLNEGMQLNFKINIGLHKEPLECFGKIVRVQVVGDPKTYEAGVSFVDIKPSDADWINKTVDECLSKIDNQ